MHLTFQIFGWAAAVVWAIGSGAMTVGSALAFVADTKKGNNDGAGEAAIVCTVALFAFLLGAAVACRVLG